MTDWKGEKKACEKCSAARQYRYKGEIKCKAKGKVVGEKRIE